MTNEACLTIHRHPGLVPGSSFLQGNSGIPEQVRDDETLSAVPMVSGELVHAETQRGLCPGAALGVLCANNFWSHAKAPRTRVTPTRRNPARSLVRPAPSSPSHQTFVIPAQPRFTGLGAGNTPLTPLREHHCGTRASLKIWPQTNLTVLQGEGGHYHLLEFLDGRLPLLHLPEAERISNPREQAQKLPYRL